MSKKIMSNTLSHKGYTGSIDISVEDGCLHGRILFIDDIVTYEGDTVEEVKSSFIAAVDRYLDYCEETGKPANKPYSGTFNVRIGPDAHRKAVEIAHLNNMTLNDFVSQSIKVAIEKNGILEVEHTHHHKVTIVDGKPSATMVASMDKPNSWEKINAVH